MALTVDLAAPARRLSDNEFRAWAQDQTVFLSSVMRELAGERRAVASTLERLGFTVRWFEEFGGRDDDAGAAYLSEVRASTIYLGLLGDQYGPMLPATDPYAGYSATHAEYLEARAHGKRISFWQREPADRLDGGARRFLADVRTFHVTGSFADADDLPSKVERRLREIASEDMSPWVKLGDVVVRATRVRVTGAVMRVEARVYDQNVLRALEELAGGTRGWARSGVQATYANRSGSGRIEEFSDESSSAAFRDVVATVKVDWAAGVEMAAGTQGFTVDDLTEVAMNVGLLGEDMPSQLGPMSFLVNATDPLAELQTLPLAEGSVAALARLLIAENLVGERRASAIERFSLGPAHRGQRHVELSWREPQRYVNVTPQSRAVSGLRRWG